MPISTRTISPKRRRRSSSSTACSRSAASSETSRSASRVTRKTSQSTISMPGNSASRWWAMTSSSATRRRSGLARRGALLAARTKRGRISVGTFTRANTVSSVARVAHEHRQAEGEVGDVGEGPPGGDRQRGQRREDHLLEVARQLGALVLVELLHADHARSRARPARGAADLRSSRSGARPAPARARGSARSSARACARPDSGSRRPRRSGRAGRRRAPCSTRRGSSCRSRRT